MRRTLLTMAALTLVTLAGCAVPLPACVNEDGSGGPTPCVWDATTRGNEIGTSYVIL